MVRQMIMPAIFVMLPISAALPAQTIVAETAADACRIRPGPTTNRDPTGITGSIAPTIAAAGISVLDRSRWVHTRPIRYLSSQHRNNHIARVVSDQIAQRNPQSDSPAATEQITTSEAPSLMEQVILRILPRAGRACPIPKTSDPGMIAAMGYADTGAETHLQMLSTPVADTYRVERRPGATGGAPSGQAVFIGTLATLLLVASGVVHLARRPRRIRLRTQRGTASDRLDRRRHGSPHPVDLAPSISSGLFEN